MGSSAWKRLVTFISDPSGLKSDVDDLNSNLSKSKEAVIDEVKAGVDALKKEISRPMNEVLADYQEQLDEATKKADFYSMSLNNLGDVMPDMLWFKYADGTYAFTNKAIRDGLLFDESPIGKTDHEIGVIAIKKFGEDSHNFGKYCAGSDQIVLDQGHRQRFIEYGMSGGKPLVLEVFKNVVMSKNGKHIIGTVGSGRDITDNIFTMFKLAECAVTGSCNECCDNGMSPILDEYLDKYLYENTAMGSSLKEFYEQHKGQVYG